jgi:hypothetical protein
MKLIRLQSGPLACVYQDEDVAAASEREVSGFYRAFSGSVEAAGASESEALDALDRNLRHLSGPPSGAIEEEAGVAAADSSDRRDTDHCERPFESRPSIARCGAPDTVRSPCPSSLPAIAFALAR